MFDELLRELDKLSRGVRLPVQVPLDEDGYLDRQCPAHHCHTEFKAHFEDWKAKVKDDSVFCPICRKEVPADAWNTSEQVQYLREIAFAHIKNTFDATVRRVRLAVCATTSCGEASFWPFTRGRPMVLGVRGGGGAYKAASP